MCIHMNGSCHKCVFIWMSHVRQKYPYNKWDTWIFIWIFIIFIWQMKHIWMYTCIFICFIYIDIDMNIHMCDMTPWDMSQGSFHTCECSYQYLYKWDIYISFILYKWDIRNEFVLKSMNFHINIHMTISTEISTPPKSTKAKNSAFSVSRGTHSNWEFGLIWICTELFEFTWFIHMCDMAHSYVWHDWFVCATGLIHMCDMTHLYV
jgi:hypothetical protein